MKALPLSAEDLKNDDPELLAALKAAYQAGWDGRRECDDYLSEFMNVDEGFAAFLRERFKMDQDA